MFVQGLFDGTKDKEIKFGIDVHKGHFEERVSRILELGLCFDF